MVGIIVSNMEASLNFYDCLGFKVKERYSENYIELVNQTLSLSLNTQELVTEVYGFKPVLTGQRIELAFVVADYHELESICARIEEQGYELIKKPWKAEWGQYYAIIRDVDGHVLSLYTEN